VVAPTRDTGSDVAAPKMARVDAAAARRFAAERILDQEEIRDRLVAMPVLLSPASR
jgi:hypothetical protein